MATFLINTLLPSYTYDVLTPYLTVCLKGVPWGDFEHRETAFWHAKIFSRFASVKDVVFDVSEHWWVCSPGSDFTRRESGDESLDEIEKCEPFKPLFDAGVTLEPWDSSGAHYDSLRDMARSPYLESLTIRSEHGNIYEILGGGFKAICDVVGQRTSFKRFTIDGVRFTNQQLVDIATFALTRNPDLRAFRINTHPEGESPAELKQMLMKLRRPKGFPGLWLMLNTETLSFGWTRRCLTMQPVANTREYLSLLQQSITQGTPLQQITFTLSSLEDQPAGEFCMGVAQAVALSSLETLTINVPSEAKLVSATKETRNVSEFLKRTLIEHVVDHPRLTIVLNGETIVSPKVVRATRASGCSVM